MTGNPFKFGTNVTNENFLNRDSDKNRLRNNFRNGINTIIISPRRWGKSSLVKETIRLMEEEDICFCYIDMFFIRSEEEFYTIFAREIFRSTAGKLEERISNIKKFLSQIVPKIQLNIDPFHDFSLSFDWVEVKKFRDDILNLPEKIAQNKGIKIVVCIDEFQNIINFKESEAFEKTLRSCWQYHQNTSYCLFGSKRHMMSDIFNRKNRAFYRFGDLILLKKIETDHWIKFITEKFNNTRKYINKEQVNNLIEKSDNHPYYIQQLSSFIWNISGNIVTDEDINKALQELLETNGIFYMKETESLSNTQINFLKAVLEGAKQFTSVETMTKYKLGTPRNVQRNREILSDVDIIDVTQNGIDFIDPLYKEWFKRNMP